MSGRANSDRLYELLADEASTGLDARELEQLEALLNEAGDIDRDELMRIAGLAQLSFLKEDGTALRALPDSLKKSLLQRADRFAGDLRSGTAEPGTVTDLDAARESRTGEPKSNKPWLKQSSVGWYLAAALAIAFLVFRTDTEIAVAPVPELAMQRLALLQQGGDVITVAWAPSQETGYTGVSGDVVWSNSSQSGYLRLSGMPINEPTEAQYQLWVVDPDRDANPVDGGVFDISGSGEVIVSIDAKLTILSPAAFAITLEKTGGVVVSDGPLLVVAPVET